MAAAFGAGRPAAVCRELTKTYEEVRREPLGDLAAWAAAGEVLGEVTVVVAGSPPPDPSALDVADLAGTVLQRVAAGERLKDAVAVVAASTGASKRALYDAAVAARSPRPR